MKIRLASVLIVVFVAWLTGCGENKEVKPELDPEVKALVETLNEVSTPLSADPMQWSNSELKFLDAISDNSIVGLGEATHGTSEFFEAKHRMFRYLVENHGFRIFAIEADFGESVLINEAVMNSDKSQIEGLMKETMHFWTWRTTEVRDLLYWMCDYNLGKTEEEKVHYWGVDCQYNTYHPDMALAYLDDAGVSFISYAQTVLAEANEATATQFSNYTKDQFDNYVQKLDALKDSLAKYETQIINATSAKHFLLTLQFVELTRQSSEVAYYAAKQTATKNYRDEYMAKNTSWLHDYFDGGKIVLWAHNFHVSDYEQASTGYFLSKAYPSDYAKIGFLFSKGTFTARKHTNEGVGELGTQSLEDDPKPGSLNDVMFRANADVLTVSVSDLGRYRVWQQAFYDEIEYIQMGSMYNNQPLHYYSGFIDRFFDRLIYIENSTATVPLK